MRFTSSSSLLRNEEILVIYPPGLQDKSAMFRSFEKHHLRFGDLAGFRFQNPVCVWEGGGGSRPHLVPSALLFLA